MKYIPVLHPSGGALQSKSVPEGFVTKDFTLMYCRVGIAHRDRNGGQCPPYLTCCVDLTWVPQIKWGLVHLVRNAGQGDPRERGDPGIYRSMIIRKV
jgi:hypothetical protein